MGDINNAYQIEVAVNLEENPNAVVEMEDMEVALTRLRDHFIKHAGRVTAVRVLVEVDPCQPLHH